MNNIEDMTDSDYENLQVGDVIKNIECTTHPYLAAVGDTGMIRRKDRRRIADYRIIRVYLDPFTNETKKYDIEIIRTYPPDAEFIVGPHEE